MLARFVAVSLSTLLAIAACSGGDSKPGVSGPGGGAGGTGGAAGSGGIDAGGSDAGAAGQSADAGCADKSDLSEGAGANADAIHPTPRYVEIGKLGAPVVTVCFDSAALAAHATIDAYAPKLFASIGLSPEPSVSCACDWTIRFEATPMATPGAVDAAWSAAGQSPERYLLVSSSKGGRALTSIFAPSERAAMHALFTTVALAQGQPLRVASATLVDHPALSTRAVLEGFYGTPYSSADRATIIRLAARLKQTAYVYGPKNDAYARESWAEPYPAAQAQALKDAAEVASEHLVDFVWSVSPGLPFAALPPGKSIKYSSDADFALLTAKIESVRALGVTRFALFLDDLTGFLVWPEDVAAFPALVDAHASLMNRLDDYLKSKDPSSRLVVVGSEYTSFWLTWDAYNTKLGKLLHPGIDVMWTGPQIYSKSIAAADLAAIDQKLGRKVSLWDNGPDSIGPLTGRAADLPTAIDGIYSNAVVNEFGKYPTSDFFKVQGTLADWAWNPGSYDPTASFARWTGLLASSAALP